MNDRIGDSACIVEDGAKVEVGLGIVRPDPNGLAEVDESLVRSAASGEGDPQIEPGLGVAGIKLDGLLKKGDCFGGLPALREGNRSLDQSVGVIHRRSAVGSGDLRGGWGSCHHRSVRVIGVVEDLSSHRHARLAREVARFSRPPQDRRTRRRVRTRPTSRTRGSLWSSLS